jgi:hypothetical protein
MWPSRLNSIGARSKRHAAGAGIRQASPAYGSGSRHKVSPLGDTLRSMERHRPIRPSVAAASLRTIAAYRRYFGAEIARGHWPAQRAPHPRGAALGREGIAMDIFQEVVEKFEHEEFNVERIERVSMLVDMPQPNVQVFSMICRSRADAGLMVQTLLTRDDAPFSKLALPMAIRAEPDGRVRLLFLNIVIKDAPAA